MKPGTIRPPKRDDGDAVVLSVVIWAERQGKQIHIHVDGAGENHTTVTSDPESPRYHRALFHNLRQVLIYNNCWPFGANEV